MTKFCSKNELKRRLREWFTELTLKNKAIASAAVRIDPPGKGSQDNGTIKFEYALFFASGASEVPRKSTPMYQNSISSG